MTAMTKPKYVLDDMGNKVEVILPVTDYEVFLELLEDSEDEKLYDEAKHEVTGERITLSEMKERLGLG